MCVNLLYFSIYVHMNINYLHLSVSERQKKSLIKWQRLYSPTPAPQKHTQKNTPSSPHPQSHIQKL